MANNQNRKKALEKFGANRIKFLGVKKRMKVMKNGVTNSRLLNLLRKKKLSLT